MEDVADALTDRFGGAAGIAEIFHATLFSTGTTSATRAKILAKMADYLAATSKQYGDRARLASMETSQIEKRLLQLLKKHNFVVPIQGISLNAGDQEDAKPGAEGQGLPPVEGSGEHDRVDQADGEDEFTGNVDA